MADDPFSAAASALGYAYQFRYSLLVALRRLRRGVGWQISIETADDLEVTDSSETGLLQLKHRAPATTLTDAGGDMWKTLRVWSEGIASERFDPTATAFFLVTTAQVTEESVSALLLADLATRNPRKAEAVLTTVAQTSNNRAHTAAYEAFLGLSDDQRAALLDAVTIIAAESDITQLGGDVREECSLAARREHLTAFLERLEGWWFRQCLHQLTKSGNAGIRAEEFDSFFSDLRDQFRETSLPIDWNELDLLDPNLEQFQDKRFVHQLRFISVTGHRIVLAVRDYLRAFTQRSRWSRDGLLLVGELERYERRLVEEWERLFHRMLEELDANATEQEMVRAARALYAWVESTADFPIRPDCNEAFMTRGSYQILADGRHVGWHPDFEARLLSLLEPPVESAAEAT